MTHKENPLTPEYLSQFFKNSEKDRSRWKIGVEQEFFGYYHDSVQRISYEKGIKKVLESFIKDYGWEPIFENENVIAIQKEESQITLEPGGQIELGSLPHTDLYAIKEQYESFINELEEISKKLRIYWVSTGYDPFSKLSEIPWMPKERYKIMRDYLPQFGDRVHHMMLATCSSQSSFDYSDEQDMRKKMLVTMAFASVAGTLCGTSPFKEGKLTGYQRFRSWAWLGIDPNRSGFLDFVFSSSFDYQKYIDFVLGNTMFLIERNKKIIDMRGMNFFHFLENGFGEHSPIEKDWLSQLGVVFPISRLKNVIETRASDAAPVSLILAQTAFWKGILYDEDSLQKAVDIALDLGTETLRNLFIQSVQDGLEAKSLTVSLFELTKELVKLSATGLGNIAEQTETKSEAVFLEPFQSSIESQTTIADRMQKLFQENIEIFQILQQENLILNPK